MIFVMTVFIEAFQIVCVLITSLLNVSQYSSKEFTTDVSMYAIIILKNAFTLIRNY